MSIARPRSRAAGALLLAAIALLAVALRLVHQAQMSASPLSRHLILDEAFNDSWAARLAAGEAGEPPPFFRAPLYPWLLGVVYRVAGHLPDRARQAQAVLAAFSCLLAFRLAVRAFGGVAGWAAALLAATYWPWIYADAELQDPPVAILLNFAALAALQETSRRRNGGWFALLAGGALGLSAITRPTVLVAAPVVLLWLLWRPTRGAAPASAGGPRTLLALCFAIGMALPIAPIALLNRVVGRDTVLIASQGGMNFYIGNHPGSDGRSARFPGATAEWEGMIEGATRAAEAAEGRPLRPSEVSRHWFAQGGRFWREQPGAALALLARKSAYLLGAPEIANDKPIRTLITRYGSFLAWPWPGFGWVLPLALVGIVWGAGRRQTALLVGFAAAYGAAVALFFVSGRHRLPMAAVLIVVAGGGVEVLRARGRDRRLWTPLAVLILVGVAVAAPQAGYRENLPHGHYLIGRGLVRDGDLGGAVAEFREAVEMQPEFPEARRSLGAALLAAGRAAEAEAASRETAGGPVDPEVRFNRALALMALGRHGEAVALLEATVAAAPRDAMTWLRLGNARLATGDRAGAEAAFVAALDLAPERPEARFNLANLRLEEGRNAEAEAHYQEVLRRDGSHAGAWTNLGVALARQGRIDAALPALARGAQLAPGRAAAQLAWGQGLEAAGRLGEARAAYATAVRVEPGSVAARLAAEALTRSSPPG